MYNLKNFLKQELDYIHNNPCSGKWMLTDCPENYLHSSAKYYFTGEQGVYPVSHIQELMDTDLTKDYLK